MLGWDTEEQGCKAGRTRVASTGAVMAAWCPPLDGVWVLLPGRGTLGLSVCSDKLDLTCHPVKREVSGLKALGLWDLSLSGETRWAGGGWGNTASSLLGSCMRLGELGTARCVPLLRQSSRALTPVRTHPFPLSLVFPFPVPYPHLPTPALPKNGNESMEGGCVSAWFDTVPPSICLFLPRISLHPVSNR